MARVELTKLQPISTRRFLLGVAMIFHTVRLFKLKGRQAYAGRKTVISLFSLRLRIYRRFFEMNTRVLMEIYVK